MRPPRFAESPDERGVGRFEKPKSDIVASLPFELRIYGGELLQTASLANVGYESDSAFLFGLPAEFKEFADEADGKIVHAEESPVLQRSEESALSRAAEAGDDHERGRFHASGSIQPIFPSFRL